MSDKKPGFIRRLLRSIWDAVNFTRRLVFNLVFLLILLVLFASFFRAQPRIDPRTALVLDVRGVVVEQYSTDPIQRVLADLGGEGNREVLLRDVLRTIDTAAGDKRIERIVLVPDQIGAGLSTLREIGQAIDRFRETGKEVVVVSEFMGQGQYYLAAHASEILLDPDGAVLLEGLSSYRNYYREALDKLGVDVHLIKVGEYKSAAEPYVRNEASAEAKEAERFWIGGLWNEMLDEVAGLRGLDASAIAHDIAGIDRLVVAYRGDLAKLALERKFVDKLATRAQVRELLKSRGVADASGETFRQVAWQDYLGMHVRDALPDPRPQVAIVVAQGTIMQGERAQGAVGSVTTAQLIRSAREDDDVKALVLRVDSPGGDAYASEVIRREIAQTQAAGKPVVVSMGDVAASGGYWIAMDANEIWAQPTTITGSIGIYGLFVTIPQTLERLGIRTDGIATTPIAGALDIRRPFNPQLEVVLTSVIEKGYADFIGKVARARGRSIEQIHEVARGRVWTGAQAKERGLVDKLGGLGEAVTSAAGLAGIGDNFRTRYVERELSTWERLAMNFGSSDVAASLVRASGWSAQWHALPARLLPKAELEQTLTLLQQLAGNRLGVVAHCFCTLD